MAVMVQITVVKMTNNLPVEASMEAAEIMGGSAEFIAAAAADNGVSIASELMRLLDCAIGSVVAVSE